MRVKKLGLIAQLIAQTGVGPGRPKALDRPALPLRYTPTSHLGRVRLPCPAKGGPRLRAESPVTGPDVLGIATVTREAEARLGGQVSHLASARQDWH